MLVSEELKTNFVLFFFRTVFLYFWTLFELIKETRIIYTCNDICIFLQVINLIFNIIQTLVHEFSMIHINIFTFYQDPYPQVDLKIQSTIYIALIVYVYMTFI